MIKIGDYLNFKAVNFQLKEVSLQDFSGVKIISSIPSIDTSTCQKQTQY
jgi:peroxiredoxin